MSALRAAEPGRSLLRLAGYILLPAMTFASWPQKGIYEALTLSAIYIDSYNIYSPLKFRVTRQSLHSQAKGFQSGHPLSRAQSPSAPLSTLQPLGLRGEPPKVGMLQIKRTISHAVCSIKTNLNTVER